MSNEHPHALLIVLFAATLAPFLHELLARLRLPLVVLEIVFGIVVGPQVLDLVALNPGLQTLSALGLTFLFLLAGMEVDFEKLRGRPMQLGILSWLFSMALAFALTFALRQVGALPDALYVAVALGTTAIGTLLPILREAGELDTSLGRFMIGAGAMGEFGPIVLFSLITAGAQGVAVRSALLATFAFIAVACAAIMLRLVRPELALGFLSRQLLTTSQLPVRLSMFLLGGLVVVADELGLDLLLGAFAAGSVVGLVSHGPRAGTFRQKLDALGFGFLIPIFFVMSGTQVDLAALLASPTRIARVPMFLLLLLIVRGVPAILYRHDLDVVDRRRLALFSATSLPLIVVIAEVGEATGRILPENAAALVGAGILSVLLFPLLALRAGVPSRVAPPVAEGTPHRLSPP